MGLVRELFHIRLQGRLQEFLGSADHNPKQWRGMAKNIHLLAQSRSPVEDI